MPQHDISKPTLPTPPPAWPRADAPMTIAFLGWGRLSAQGKEGSGYNLSASELAAGLALSGHSVVYLRSGMDYALRPGVFIKRVADWRGIACYHLFNSPNLSPAVFNFSNMRAEMESPKQTAAVLDWLDATGAQSVHVHSLEGFSYDLIPAIRESGRPVVFTTHNYHPICPQVDLLYKDQHLCMDYEGGKRCESCLTPATPFRARNRRRLDQSVARILGRRALPIYHALLGLKVIPRAVTRLFKAKSDPVHPALDDELALGYEHAEPTPDGRSGQQPTIEEHEQFDPPSPLPRDTNERFRRADHHLNVLNDYGKRRTAGIEAMTSASLVTPPSAFMTNVYRDAGVPDDKLRHVRLGQPHFDAINRRARRSEWYETRPWDPDTATRPLRLAFFGTVRHNKGLDILCRAIESMDPKHRRRCQFLIRAGGGDWLFRRRLARVPEASFLGGYDPMHLLAAAGEFDVGILPHIWFENSPLVMLEFLHAGKFTIASRLGGPPDWIHEPGSPKAEPNGGLGNGLLVKGADPDDLATAIERVVRGDVTIPSPREIHAASELHSYPAHVREVESIHAELLGMPTPRVADPDRSRATASSCTASHG